MKSITIPRIRNEDVRPDEIPSWGESRKGILRAAIWAAITGSANCDMIRLAFSAALERKK